MPRSEYQIDLTVTSDEQALGAVLLGRGAFGTAVSSGKIVLEGPSRLVRDFPTWLGVTRFARYATSVA